MFKYFFAVFVLSFSIIWSNYADARSLGRGYAKPNLKNMSQTFVALNGNLKDLDQMIDEYAEITQCSMFQSLYADDFEWNPVRQALKNKLRNRNPTIRRHFELNGVLYLDRYDFVQQAYPISERSALDNVGTLILHETSPHGMYCDRIGIPKHIPLRYQISLFQPLNVKEIKIAEAEARNFLEKAKKFNGKRVLFSRFRIKIVDYIGIDGIGMGRAATFRGEVESVDIFRDRELTEFMMNIPIETY